MDPQPHYALRVEKSLCECNVRMVFCMITTPEDVYNFRSRPLIFPNSTFDHWLNGYSFANDLRDGTTVSPFIISTVSLFSYFHF